MSDKVVKSYYTPIEVEREFKLNRSTLRKYSLLIDEKAEATYFKQENINGRLTRVYNISEILLLQEVYRMSVTDRIDLNDAIQQVFFSSDTLKNDAYRIPDMSPQRMDSSDTALREVLEAQTKLIAEQSQMIQQQGENMARLIEKLDQLLSEKATPELEITQETEADEAETPSQAPEPDAPQLKWWQKLFKP